VLELLELVIRFAIRHFGAEILDWTVRKLLDSLRAEAVTDVVPEEKFIWDEDPCPPFA
jgi:hypothetical protein